MPWFLLLSTRYFLKSWSSVVYEQIKSCGLLLHGKVTKVAKKQYILPNFSFDFCIKIFYFTYFLNDLENHGTVVGVFKFCPKITGSVMANWVFWITRSERIFKLDFVWRWFWNPEIWEILMLKPAFMKCMLCAIYGPIWKHTDFFLEKRLWMYLL